MNKYERKLNTLLERKKANKGFTLVELVVVIAIIAVLAGVSVAGYMGYTDNAKKRVAQSEATDIRTQFNVWYASSTTMNKTVFEQIDEFRQDMLNEGVIQADTDKNKSINFYVDAASLDANYDVTMFYTSSNGLVSEYKLGANATSLTGEISLEKYDYSSLNRALESSVGSDADLAKEVLQYKAGAINYKTYSFFDMNGHPISIAEDSLTLKNGASKSKAEIYETINELKDEETIQKLVDAVNSTSMNSQLIGMLAVGIFADQIGEYDGYSANYSNGELKVFNYMNGMTYSTYSTNLVEGLSTMEKLVYDPGFTEENADAISAFESVMAANGASQVDWRVGAKWQSRTLSSDSSTDRIVLGETLNGIVAQELGGSTSNLALTNSNGLYVPAVNNYSFASTVTNGLVYETFPVVENANSLDKALTQLANRQDKVDLYVQNSSIKDNTATLSQDVPANVSVYLSTSELLTGQYLLGDEPADKVTTTVVVSSDISISGSLTLGGEVYYKQPNTTNPGDIINIRLKNDATITVENGGVLNCYGTITGEGKVVVKDGGELLEPMSICDFKGGSFTTNVLRENIFPFSKYDVSRIVCPIQFEAGAEYVMEAYAELGNLGVLVSVPFIGHAGIFEVKSGYVTKEVNDSRMTITANGDFIDHAVTIQAGPMPIDLTKTPFPIYNIDLVIESGSAVIDDLKMKFLPGSSMTIKEGASFTISGDAQIAVYETFTSYNTNTETLDERIRSILDKCKSTFDDLCAPAYIDVYGTLVINSAIGGLVNKYTTGVVNISESAVRSVQFKEGVHFSIKGAPEISIFYDTSMDPITLNIVEK